MATRTPSKPKEISAPASFVEPSYGGYDHSVSIQMLMEIQKSIVKIDCKIETLESSIQSTKSKVEDLVKWKYLIVGGATVAAFAITGAAYVAKSAIDTLNMTVKTELVNKVTPSPPKK